MESGRQESDSNAEVNGTNKPTVATYKSLPDEDANWQSKSQEKITEMGKPDAEEVDDGAKEKMLNDEAKITPNKDVSQVVFISENGDAKIDVSAAKPTLSGMGKEELMKYANDPFWIRLRWFLFIGFWVVWFSMLAGAVAIIVLAPKCTSPQPKTWWEKSPVVQLEPRDLEGRDAQSLDNLLETLKAQHVAVLSLSSMLKTSAPGHVTDFHDVDARVGIETVRSLIKLAKEKEQRVVLELDPNHSGIEHSWFQKSVNREDPYTDYYVWASPKLGADGSNNPPNNWLSMRGRSAWEWSPQRGQYYLHQFNRTQPDLNFNNSLVVAEFTRAFTHWLDLGISGFRLGATQYIAEDPSLLDEQRSSQAAEPDEYDSLIHVHTKDRVENADVLRVWRDNIANSTAGDALFALRDDIGADILAVFNEKRRLVDLPQSSQFLANADAAVSARVLENGIVQWRHTVNATASDAWPGWDLNGKERALRERMAPAIADSLVLMSLLLPGTPILKLNDTLSAASGFATLAEKRKEEIFQNGDFNSHIVNGTVFVYTRLKSGHPGYLVAYQSSEYPAVIDVSELPHVPEEVNVLTYSPNYAQNGQTIETKLWSNRVPIAAKSTVVLTFVPS